MKKSRLRGRWKRGVKNEWLCVHGERQDVRYAGIKWVKPDERREEGKVVEKGRGDMRKGGGTEREVI